MTHKMFQEKEKKKTFELNSNTTPEQNNNNLNQFFSRNQDDNRLHPLRATVKKSDKKGKKSKCSSCISGFFKVLFFPFDFLFKLTIPNLRSHNVNKCKFTFAFIMIVFYIVILNYLIFWAEYYNIKSLGYKNTIYGFTIKVYLGNLASTVYFSKFTYKRDLFYCFISSFQQITIMRCLVSFTVTWFISYLLNLDASIEEHRFGIINAIIVVVVYQLWILVIYFVKPLTRKQNFVGIVNFILYIILSAEVVGVTFFTS